MTDTEAAKKLKASLAAKDRAKKQYAKADALLDEVIAAMPVGFAVPLKDGSTATVVDNYDGKNVAWGHGSVRRFDVRVK